MNAFETRLRFIFVRKKRVKIVASLYTSSSEF